MHLYKYPHSGSLKIYCSSYPISKALKNVGIRKCTITLIPAVFQRTKYSSEISLSLGIEFIKKDKLINTYSI